MLKRELNANRVEYIITAEMKHVCRLTAIDPKKEKARLDKEKKHVKTVKFLKKKEKEIVEYFDENQIEKDSKLRLDIMDCFNKLESHSVVKSANPNSKFHKYMSSNLFVTSLFIYGCLNDKDEKRRSIHEENLLALLERNSRDKKRKNIDDMVVSSMERNRWLEDFNNQFGKELPIKAIRDTQRSLMPAYDPFKKITGYKAALKRTLLESKAIRFKDADTLDKVASYASVWDYYPLIETMFHLRYSYIRPNSRSTIELLLEGWALIVVTNKGRGETSSRVHINDIRKLKRDEREYMNYEDEDVFGWNFD